MKRLINNDKKIRNMLIVNNIFNLLWIIFLFLFLYVFNNIDPYPERYFISQMNSIMIQEGQHINLVIIYLTGSLMALSILIAQALNIRINYFFFTKIKFNFFKTHGKKHLIFLNFICKFIFYMLYIFIGLILGIYFWYLYLSAFGKINNHYFIFKRMNYSLRTVNKVFWISTPIVAFSIPPIALEIYLNLPRKFTYSLQEINYQNQFLTLSNNQPNSLVFYFDRSQGIVFNTLLIADYYLNKEESIICMFPEFTSYTNTMSLNFITLMSIPTIFGGNLFSPWIKNIDYLNPNLTISNKNMNMDQWYLSSISLFVKMINEFNFNDVVISSVPYYGKSFDNSSGDMEQLNKDIQKQNLNAKFITNKKLATYNMDLKLKNKDTVSKADYHILKELSNHLKYKSTNTGVFRWFHSQATHEPYIYGNNNIGYGDSYYLRSIWDTIQNIKSTLISLKQTPFLDNNGNKVVDSNNNIISVYDKTMISIISDHGFQDVGNYYMNKIINYLYSKKLIIESEKQMLQKFDLFGFTNNTMMIKNFKYDANMNEIDKFSKSFFDNTKLVSLTDFPTIIENNLIKYNNKQYQDNKTYFWDPNVDLKNETLTQMLKSQYVSDPLDSNLNNWDTLREFIIIWPRPWYYEWNKKYIKFKKIYQYKNNKEKNSNFDYRNYTKLK